MKDISKNEYTPVSYYDWLFDNWQWFTQVTKSVKDYVVQFGEFSIRCIALGTEGNGKVLSIFRAELKEDLRSELLASGGTEFEMAYALVQDLEAVKSSYTFKGQTNTQIDFKLRCQRPKRIPMVGVLKREPKERAFKRSHPNLIP